MIPHGTYHSRKLAARALLLTGYLIFFATQFTGRYYAIANFFVYKTGTTVTLTADQHSPVHGQIYRDNTRHPAHLGIDKRFSYKTAIQPVFPGHQAPVPSYIIITRKALPPPAVYATPDLPTNSLRGPPTV